MRAEGEAGDSADTPVVLLTGGSFSRLLTLFVYEKLSVASKIGKILVSISNNYFLCLVQTLKKFRLGWK